MDPRLGRLLDRVLGRQPPENFSNSFSYVSNSLLFSHRSFQSKSASANLNLIPNATDDYDDCDDLAVAASVEPPESYDFLLRMAEYASAGKIFPLPTPWSSRALSTHSFDVCGTKYKPVSRKVRPVPTYMPNPAAVVFKPIEVGILEPLTLFPRALSEFVPTERLSHERLTKILSTVPDGFLRPAEIDLLVDVLVRREKAIAFCDNERGVLSRVHFPDYEIPVIEHTPWAINPLRFPAAIADDVRRLLREQILANKYEYACSSYRSRMWAVAKKGGKLRLVLDLQELNRVVVRDASLPPHPHDFAEDCAGHACYGLADLFGAFDAVTLAMTSRDLTTFQALDKVLRNTCCPQGLTNALQWFQRTSTHTLGEDSPGIARIFVDDLIVKGPKSTYNDELMPGSDVRKFIYEYATSLDRVFARLIVAGFTASGTKLVLATPRVTIVGSSVSAKGWHLEHGMATKILNWPTPRSMTELRGFLGVAGVARRWIKGFSLIAKPLTLLIRKTDNPDDSFVFTQDGQRAMDALKKLISSPPVLRPIDYNTARYVSRHSVRQSNGEVTVAVDSSMYGAGFILYQQNEIERHPALFGSCTFNQVESRYSQPKLELYGVFRAVRELRHRIWSLFFILEVDAKFLEQMVSEPDLPNAPMTRWVSYINLFDYKIQHVPAAKGLGQDGLSRRGGATDDTDESDIEDFLDDFLGCAGEISHKSSLSRRHVNIRALLLYDAMKAGYPGHIGYDSSPVSRVITADCYSASVSILGDFDTPKSDAVRLWTAAWLGSDTIGVPMKSPFDANIYRGRPMWSYRVNEANRLFNHVGDGSPSTIGSSPFHGSFLRNDDDQTYVGLEFMTRHVGIEKSDMVLLGSEVSELPYVEYRWAYAVDQDEGFDVASDGFMTNRLNMPDVAETTRDEVRCIGHEHGIKFDEYEGVWDDVMYWLRTGERPERFLGGSSPGERIDRSAAYKRFARRFRTYFIQETADGEILFRAQGSRLPQRVIVIKDRRKSLIAAAHNNCGHRGRDATFHHLNDRYWWPNIYDDVAWFTRSCNSCQLRSKLRPIVALSPSHSTVMFRAFVCDSIDMPPAWNGCKFMLHFSEALSKGMDGRASKAKDADNWARFFWEDLICRFGCVPIIICDGGSEFKGAAKILLEKYGVQIIISSPYYPQGNGVAERDGQTLINAVLRCCGDKPSRWPDFLHAALFAARTTVSRTTGYTPFFLMYGQEALLPFDLTDRSWYALDWDTVRTTEDLLTLRTKQIGRRDEHLGPASAEATRTRQKAIDNYMKKNEKRLVNGDYEPGTWVLVHETWLDRQLGNKGHLRFAGPYIVHSKHQNNNYRLRELDGSLIKEAVPAARLKIFFYRTDFQTMSTLLSPLPIREESFLNNFTPLFCGWTYDVKYGRVLRGGVNTHQDLSRADRIQDLIEYQDRFVDGELIWIVRCGFLEPPERPSDIRSDAIWSPMLERADRRIKLSCDLRWALRMAEFGRPHW